MIDFGELLGQSMLASLPAASQFAKAVPHSGVEPSHNASFTWCLYTWLYYVQCISIWVRPILMQRQHATMHIKPSLKHQGWRIVAKREQRSPRKKLRTQPGIEPRTFRLLDRCSYHMQYSLYTLPSKVTFSLFIMEYLTMWVCERLYTVCLCTLKCVRVQFTSSTNSHIYYNKSRHYGDKCECHTHTVAKLRYIVCEWWAGE